MGLIGLLARLATMLVGYTYPAYNTYKALTTGTPDDVRQLTIYWTVIGMLTAIEMISDFFFFWLPFYYESKLLLVMWLVFPNVNGAVYTYHNFIGPWLVEYESEIDASVTRVRSVTERNSMQVAQRAITWGRRRVYEAATGQPMYSSDALHADAAANDDPDHGLYESSPSEPTHAPVACRRPRKSASAAIAPSGAAQRASARATGTTAPATGAPGPSMGLLAASWAWDAVTHVVKAAAATAIASRVPAPSASSPSALVPDSSEAPSSWSPDPSTHPGGLAAPSILSESLTSAAGMAASSFMGTTFESARKAAPAPVVDLTTEDETSPMALSAGTSSSTAGGVRNRRPLVNPSRPRVTAAMAAKPVARSHHVSPSRQHPPLTEIASFGPRTTPHLTSLLAAGTSAPSAPSLSIGATSRSGAVASSGYDRPEMSYPTAYPTASPPMAMSMPAHSSSASSTSSMTHPYPDRGASRMAGPFGPMAAAPSERELDDLAQDVALEDYELMDLVPPSASSSN